jgi:DNA replication protein DnaC
MGRSLFSRTPRLFGELALARAAGECASLLAKLSRFEVLVLDDFLLNPTTDGAISSKCSKTNTIDRRQ